MSELCVDCYKINYPDKDISNVVLSKYDDFCDECEEFKPSVVRVRESFFEFILPLKQKQH